MHKRLSSDTVREILRLRSEGNLSFRKIGRKLGLSPECCRKYWKNTAGKSAAPLPEFTDLPGPPKETDINVLIDNTEVDGTVSIVKRHKPARPQELKDRAGLGAEWIATHHKERCWEVALKLKQGKDRPDIVRKEQLWGSVTTFRKIIDEEMRAAILEWVQEIVNPIPVPPTPKRDYLQDTPFMVSLGLYDLHIGMYAFAKEVGRDWDVEIAVNRALNAIDDMVEELLPYNIVKILLPIGNDFMHFDNVRQRTTEAQHDLDSDSRWQRALRAAIHVLTYLVQRMTELCEDLDIFWVPGNHDVYTSYQLTAYLWGRFHGDDRIKVDLNEDPQKIRRYGSVAIIYEHGQEVPINRWPLIFHERVLEHAEKHGLSTKLTHKEVQLGHTHQKKVKDFMSETPVGGIKVVVNPTLCNHDFWHHKKGFIGTPQKSVEAYRYDEIGVRGSHVVWARDDKRNLDTPNGT